MLTLPTVKELIDIKDSLQGVRVQLVLSVYSAVKNRRKFAGLSFFENVSEQQLQTLKMEFEDKGYKFEWDFSESSSYEIVTTVYIYWNI